MDLNNLYSTNFSIKNPCGAQDAITISTYVLSRHIQGSCLGAPIFNVYTNDLLENNSKNSTVIVYADDTNIIVSGNNLRELIETANNELEKISAYMASNSLLINTQKTQAILFTPKNKKTTPKA